MASTNNIEVQITGRPSDVLSVNAGDSERAVNAKQDAIQKAKELTNGQDIELVAGKWNSDNQVYILTYTVKENQKQNIIPVGPQTAVAYGNTFNEAKNTAYRKIETTVNGQNFVVDDTEYDPSTKIYSVTYHIPTQETQKKPSAQTNVTDTTPSIPVSDTITICVREDTPEKATETASLRAKELLGTSAVKTEAAKWDSANNTYIAVYAAQPDNLQPVSHEEDPGEPIDYPDDPGNMPSQPYQPPKAESGWSYTIVSKNESDYETARNKAIQEAQATLDDGEEVRILSDHYDQGTQEYSLTYTSRPNENVYDPSPETNIFQRYGITGSGFDEETAETNAINRARQTLGGRDPVILDRQWDPDAKIYEITYQDPAIPEDPGNKSDQNYGFVVGYGDNSVEARQSAIDELRRESGSDTTWTIREEYDISDGSYKIYYDDQALPDDPGNRPDPYDQDYPQDTSPQPVCYTVKGTGSDITEARNNAINKIRGQMDAGDIIITKEGWSDEYDDIRGLGTYTVTYQSSALPDDPGNLPDDPGNPSGTGQGTGPETDPDSDPEQGGTAQNTFTIYGFGDTLEEAKRNAYAQAYERAGFDKYVSETEGSWNEGRGVYTLTYNVSNKSSEGQSGTGTGTGSGSGQGQNQGSEGSETPQEESVDGYGEDWGEAKYNALFQIQDRLDKGEIEITGQKWDSANNRYTIKYKTKKAEDKPSAPSGDDKKDEEKEEKKKEEAKGATGDVKDNTPKQKLVGSYTNNEKELRSSPGYTNYVVSTGKNINGTIASSSVFKRYYSDISAEAYINGEWFEDINTIAWNVTQQQYPLYGYNSYVWDDLALGTRIIQGQFTINFTEPNIIEKAIAQGSKGTSVNNGTTFEEYSTKAHQNKVAIDGTEVTYRNNDLRSTIWKPRFDIDIVFGEKEKLGGTDIMPRHIILWDCSVSSSGIGVSANGGVLVETYTFIARDFKIIS